MKETAMLNMQTMRASQVNTKPTDVMDLIE